MIPVQDPIKLKAGPILSGVPFALNLKFVDNEHVKARINHANSTYTELTYGTQYLVTGENTDEGSMELVSPVQVADGDNLVAYLDVPLEQATSYQPVNRFPASLVEKQLDQLTLSLQSLNEKIDRALTFPIGSNITTSLPLLATGRCFKGNAEGTGFINTTYDPDEQVTLAAAAAEIAVNSQQICEALVGQIPDEVGHGGESLFQKDDETGFEYRTVFNVEAPIAKMAHYSIQNNEWVLVNSTSGAVDITLPSTGKCRVTWSSGSNTVRILGTINGITNYTIKLLNDSIDLMSTGTNQWRII